MGQVQRNRTEPDLSCPFSSQQIREQLDHINGHFVNYRALFSVIFFDRDPKQGTRRRPPRAAPPSTPQSPIAMALGQQLRHVALTAGSLEGRRENRPDGLVLLGLNRCAPPPAHLDWTLADRGPWPGNNAAIVQCRVSCQDSSMVVLISKLTDEPCMHHGTGRLNSCQDSQRFTPAWLQPRHMCGC